MGAEELAEELSAELFVLPAELLPPLLLAREIPTGAVDAVPAAVDAPEDDEPNKTPKDP